MNTAKYKLPSVLAEKCSQKDYTHWLSTKAAAHVKRDKNRGNIVATREMYKRAIHEAVCAGGDRDAYTGKTLNWYLIRTYDNAAAKKGGREYKKKFADLPTLDHEDEGRAHPHFKICSWRTNDCKHDLSVEELAVFCREFLEYQARHSELGAGLKTTAIGYINRNNQKNLGPQNKSGNDHNQYLYTLQCQNQKCRHEYGCNGSDIFQRKCPKCGGGRPGL